MIPQSSYETLVYTAIATAIFPAFAKFVFDNNRTVKKMAREKNRKIKDIQRPKLKTIPGNES